MSLHEDDEEAQITNEPVYDEKAHQGCYIFKPSQPPEHMIDDRPKKRRKTTQSTPRDDTPRFPLLLGGQESVAAAELRKTAFAQVWTPQQEKIDRIVSRVDEAAVRNVASFVKSAPHREDGRLPTGLVVAGLDGNVQSRLLRQWREGQSTDAESVAQLDSSQSPNLQTALKNIIKTTIMQVDGNEGYLDFLTKHKRLIPMPFDLELLQVFADENDLQKVVVSISDVEAFDMSVLSDLISSLSSWSDRIHFVLLLGLATTVDLFESRLPKSIARLLDAKIFDLSTNRDINFEIYRAIQADFSTKLWLGPLTSGNLIEMSKDQDTTPESFSRAIKYAYMSHFFANPLSLLLADSNIQGQDQQIPICEVIRHTESFQKHTEKLLGSSSGAKEIRKLLDDNDHLLSTARAAVVEGQQKMAMLFEAIDAFKELPQLLMLQPPANASAFDIDMEALSGRDFINSDPYISITSIIEKLRSDHLLHVLSPYSLAHRVTSAGRQGYSRPPLEDTRQKLRAFQATVAHPSIRSSYDASHSAHATTVTQQGRVGITKQTPTLTPAEQAYTDIVDSLLAALEMYFDTHITQARHTNLFLNEAFVYDLKIPLAGAFASQPRYAVERALDRPGDYLGCVCCTGGTAAEAQKHDRMPPTSVLWRLWCEAGNVVNVRDLWEAFRGVLVGDQEQNGAVDDNMDEMVDGTDETDDTNAHGGKMNDRMALALFYRGLAELKMLGFVKASKKKPGVDCLAKTTWAGL